MENDKPNNLSEAQQRETISFLTREVEPRIDKLVRETNAYLAKRGIEVGVELQWFINLKDGNKANKRKEK